MTTDPEIFGWGEPAARGGGQGAAGAPGFVRHDRGDADDNWIHADGEACTKCGAGLTTKDFVRRTATGGWAYENCPTDDS